MSLLLHSTSPPPQVLQCWSDFADAAVRPIHSGLINTTFELSRADGRKAILQRLHPVFGPEVHYDIEAVTAHLAARGLTTPRLLRTDDHALWVASGEGLWRALTHLKGTAPEHFGSPAMAREAGALVGRFHAALMDFDYQYRSRRGNVHDTAVHLERLETALRQHRGHRLYGEVAFLAEGLLRAAEDLVDLDGLPLRHAHGDLKVSNVMFDARRRGLALIDLDTLTRMHWPLEMGDALRSWCNPRSENQLAARLDLDLLEAAVGGYRTGNGGGITEEEWEALVSGLERICLELSSRFLADALNELYFGWDPHHYPARGEHNLARGRAMWALYLDVLNKRAAAQERVHSARA
jgi:Ser/Thr protein kinase RdoA (MazF antagonist)